VLFRAIWAVAGRRFMLRGIAAWTAVGIPAVVVFWGNGMDARDLVRLMHASLGARALLWGGWCVIAAPVVAPLFDAPGMRTLRSLRRKHALLGALAPYLIAVQLPWAILFARGEGVFAGIGAATLAVAIECGLVSGGAWISALGALAALLDLGGFSSIVGLGLGALAIDAAWRRTFERAPSSRKRLWVMPPLFALALAHLLFVVRASRTRLAFAALSAVLAGVAAYLSLHNDAPARPLQRALEIWSFPLSVAAGVLVRPVLDSEASIRALLRSTRTHAALVASAFVLAIAFPSSAFGATAAAIARPSFVVQGAGWAFVLSAAVAAWGRGHDRLRGRDPALFVVGVLVIAFVATWVVSV
jgi:hypothetical protein